MTLTHSVLAQQVYEPAADCVYSSLIDLSERADVHTDRISPAVTHRSHMGKQMSASTYRKTEGKERPAPLSRRQSDSVTDRIGQGELIHKTAA